MSSKRNIIVNIADPADDLMFVQRRLFTLAQEQEDKGHMALSFVLSDIYDKLSCAINNGAEITELKKNRCSVCKDTHQIGFWFDQDDCRLATCPFCSNGDMETYLELKKLKAGEK